MSLSLCSASERETPVEHQGCCLVGLKAPLGAPIAVSGMSENMVQELERLRKLLDTTSPEQLKKSLARAGSDADTAFSGALTAAEVMHTLSGVSAHSVSQT